MPATQRIWRGSSDESPMDRELGRSCGSNERSSPLSVAIGKQTNNGSTDLLE